VTLDVVRSGEFVEWAPAEQRTKLRHMHYKALWYSAIGHATKPAFRGGDFLLARADFERVNGFDENFLGWGCEDDDFGRRLRAAGVRLISVLNRTWVYHLWHPPAPTRPSEWKQGGNVSYLQREVRLTRCAAGLAVRGQSDLAVRLAGQPANWAALERLVALHQWNLDKPSSAGLDLELLCRPGSGRFSGRADCRVLILLDEHAEEAADTRQAHVVLSKSGRAGREGQVRLQLEDAAALWDLLQGRQSRQQLAAA
jgi:hypothetical protein